TVYPGLHERGDVPAVLPDGVGVDARDRGRVERSARGGPWRTGCALGPVGGIHAAVLEAFAPAFLERVDVDVERAADLRGLHLEGRVVDGRVRRNGAQVELHERALQVGRLPVGDEAGGRAEILRVVRRPELDVRVLRSADVRDRKQTEPFVLCLLAQRHV